MGNSFNEASSLERKNILKLFTRLGIGEYELTPEFGYDRYDLYFWVGQKKFISEVKNRYYVSGHFAGWIIEKDKYEFLMQQPEIQWYINFFTDGWSRMWLLREQQIEWYEMELPVTSCVDKGTRLKTVGMLSNKNSRKKKYE